MAVPQYAIMRFMKYKGPEIGKIEAHDERTKESYAIPDNEKMGQEQASLINVPDSFKKIIVAETGLPL